MKKNNIILIILIILSISLNIFLYSNKDTIIDKDINNKNINNNEDTSKIKVFTNYKEVEKFDDYFKKIEIKNWLVTDKNTLDNIISLCNFLEKKNNYIYNKWKKIFLDRNTNVISLIESNLSKKEIIDFKNLKNGKITWVYKNIYKWNEEDIDKYLNYLWQYMLFIKDNKEYNIYYKQFFSILYKKHYVSENYIIPIILDNFYRNKECSNFINTNFISY